MAVTMTCDKCGSVLGKGVDDKHTWYTCSHYINMPTKAVGGAFYPLVNESHLCYDCEQLYKAWLEAGVESGNSVLH